MISNRKLSRAISDIRMYEFKRQLNYKAELKGNIILENDRWFASSKTYPDCGNIKKDLTLKDRVYKCEVCGLKGDRDHMASIITYREFIGKYVEITALNLSIGLIDLTSIVKV